MRASFDCLGLSKFTAAVLLCCCAAVLLCCCAAVLLCCCAALSSWHPGSEAWITRWAMPAHWLLRRMGDQWFR
ncbi:hypothetical protein C6B42_15675 [Aeromonas caviae]|nr:hypothetical protein C6B42_15675 [Aeromonas caviae]